MTHAVRVVNGLVFECTSPSVWYLRDQPVVLAYNGSKWVLSVFWNNKRKEYEYCRRETAIHAIDEAFGRTA